MPGARRGGSDADLETARRRHLIIVASSASLLSEHGNQRRIEGDGSAGNEASSRR